MKLFALSLLISLNVFAVEVRNCPSTLELKLSEVALAKTPQQVLDESYFGMEQEEIVSVQETFKNLKGIKQVIRTLPLESARNGRCVYRIKESVEKAELFTKAGQATLLFQINAGPKGILLRTYSPLASLNPKGVILQDQAQSAYLAIPRSPHEDYSVGGDLVLVGKSKLAVKSL